MRTPRTATNKLDKAAPRKPQAHHDSMRAERAVAGWRRNTRTRRMEQGELAAEAGGNDERRNQNDESMTKSEGRMNIDGHKFVIRASDLFRHSGFGIRHLPGYHPHPVIIAIANKDFARCAKADAVGVIQ
jgi:hypothetical protein